MKKWTSVGRALTPDGKTVTLEEHDGSYLLRIDGVGLMSTRQHASEDKLAELACAHLKGARRARVLIGGLGFGYTLRAVLAAVGADATVVVAELLPEVIEWNSRPSLPLAADAMADPRVSVRQQDVADAIAAAPGGYDSIILDVDNGPSALTLDGNDKLYNFVGVQAIRAALRPGGCLAIWATSGDPAFERFLTHKGFAVEVKRCHAHGKSGGLHTLILAKLGQAGAREPKAETAPARSPVTDRAKPRFRRGVRRKRP
jgi:spermidine synthase